MKKFIQYILIFLILLGFQGYCFGQGLYMTSNGGVNYNKNPIEHDQERYKIPDSLYGANLQNTLYKLHYKDILTQNPVRIVVIGDSIIDYSSATTWLDLLETQLQTNFGSDNLTVVNAAVGGYNFSMYDLYFESYAVDQQTDLFIISELNDNSSEDLAALDKMIKLIRENSGADIIIGTWSANIDDLIDNFDTFHEQDAQVGVKNMRALANKYSCAIFDINDALYREVNSGTNAKSLYTVDNLSSTWTDEDTGNGSHTHSYDTSIVLRPHAVYTDAVELTENDGEYADLGTNEWDWDSSTLYVNIGGTPTTMTYIESGEVHLSNAGHQAAFDREVGRHFQVDYHYYNTPNLFLNSEIFTSFADVILHPRYYNNGDITLSGSWISSINIGSDIEYFSKVVSSTSTDYIEVDFKGIGIEVIALTGSDSDHTILIDGVAPSAVTVNGSPLEYATMIEEGTGTDYITKAFKVRVTSRFLDDGETNRNFKITFDSATTYTLEDTDNSITLTGDQATKGLITADSTFTHSTRGTLVIPANYAGRSNFIGAFVTNDEMTFTIEPNWIDSFQIVGVTYKGATEVLNGDFEATPFDDGITAYLGATYAASTERTGGAGAVSLEMTKGDSSLLVGWFPATASVVGEWYEISFWAKVGTATGIYMKWGMGGSDESGTQTNSATTTSWENITKTFQILNGGTGNLRFYVSGIVGTTAYLDDVTLRKINSPESDIRRFKIYGLNSGDHTIRITKGDSIQSSWVGMRVFDSNQ